MKYIALLLFASTCFGDALICRMDLRGSGSVDLPARMEVAMPVDGIVTHVCYGARIEFAGWLDLVMAVEDVASGSRFVEREYRLEPLGRGTATLNFSDMQQHADAGQRFAFILEETGRSDGFSGSFSLIPQGDGFAIGVYGHQPEPAAGLLVLSAAWWLSRRRET